MTSEIEVVEERLKSFLVQLQAECGILERITYKNKNQHRRTSYFQYLLKVRRDQKLLNSIHLEELLESCFHVINGRKAKQKVHLLESLKRRKCEAGKYNFLERLLGAARLLSQMTEPILKAATEISTLLARSFFMGFSLTILSLLARLRVLVQQLLLDVVVVFNEVSSLSQRKQSIKITQDGVDVFREYYPTMEEFLTLECVWKIDKFVLAEKCSMKRQEYGNQEVIDPPGTPAIQYQSIEAFLGEDELVSKKANADSDAEENPSFVEEKQTLASPLTEADHSKVVEDPLMPQADSGLVVPPSKSLDLVGCLLSTSSSSSMLKSKTMSRGRGVAFISVKKPAPPAAGAAELGNDETESKRDD